MAKLTPERKSEMDDPFDLDRFVKAQNGGSTYLHALDQLRRGRKESHWMWFVFPQLAGLGRSRLAREYAIASADEARAYARHPVLGERLRECARTLIASGLHDPVAIFGVVDSFKLRSSMTLFSRAVPDEPLFGQVIDEFFDGAADPWTVERVEARSRGSAGWRGGEVGEFSP
jgi:uncharacterized protein (DUF1810 family)